MSGIFLDQSGPGCLKLTTCKSARDQARGRLGEIVSLQGQTSPCSELREKLKCIDYIGKDETSH